MVQNDAPHRSVERTEHLDDLLGFGVICEGREAPQINEDHADLPPVRLECLLTLGDDRLGQLGRKEAL